MFRHAELRKIDTPTITNVVATYPKNPLCLGLYNSWTENWYTDTSIRCMYPEMGALIGYAVTCVYGLPDPNFAGRLNFMDVVDALDAQVVEALDVCRELHERGDASTTCELGVLNQPAPALVPNQKVGEADEVGGGERRLIVRKAAYP